MSPLCVVKLVSNFACLPRSSRRLLLCRDTRAVNDLELRLLAALRVDTCVSLFQVSFSRVVLGSAIVPSKWPLRCITIWSSRSLRCVEGSYACVNDCVGGCVPKFVVFMMIEVGGYRWLDEGSSYVSFDSGKLRSGVDYCSRRKI